MDFIIYCFIGVCYQCSFFTDEEDNKHGFWLGILHMIAWPAYLFLTFRALCDKIDLIEAELKRGTKK